MRIHFLTLLLATFVAGCASSFTNVRAGSLRVCAAGDNAHGCKCNKTSDCRDYTRERAGFCDPTSGICIHCLHGQHFVGNFSASFFSEAHHRCVRSDSCEEIRDERNYIMEVECIDGKCHREGQESDEICSCREGFLAQRMWDGRIRCADDNECEGIGKHNCSPRHCINTEGGYECDCRPGYRLVNKDTAYEHCEEIDECLEVIGICPQGCRNVPGTFNCTCHIGYMPMYEDGRMHCVDIDECQLDVCHPMTTCYNTIGSHYCATPVQVPQSFGGWAMTLIPMFICIIVLVLCCRNRTLEQEILRMSNEDLAEKGRYEVSAKIEKIDADA